MTLLTNATTTAHPVSTQTQTHAPQKSRGDYPEIMITPPDEPHHTLPFPTGQMNDPVTASLRRNYLEKKQGLLEQIVSTEQKHRAAEARALLLSPKCKTNPNAILVPAPLLKPIIELRKQLDELKHQLSAVKIKLQGIEPAEAVYSL